MAVCSSIAERNFWGCTNASELRSLWVVSFCFTKSRRPVSRCQLCQHACCKPLKPSLLCRLLSVHIDIDISLSCGLEICLIRLVQEVGDVRHNFSLELLKLSALAFASLTSEFTLWIMYVQVKDKRIELEKLKSTFVRRASDFLRKYFSSVVDFMISDKTYFSQVILDIMNNFCYHLNLEASRCTRRFEKAVHDFIAHHWQTFLFWVIQRGQLKRPDHADLRFKCRTYARMLQHLKVIILCRLLSVHISQCRLEHSHHNDRIAYIL